MALQFTVLWLYLIGALISGLLLYEIQSKRLLLSAVAVALWPVFFPALFGFECISPLIKKVRG